MTTPEDTRDVRRLIFTYRSYTPIPFLLVMIWFAQPTPLSMVVGFAVAFVGEIIEGVLYTMTKPRARHQRTGLEIGSGLLGPFDHGREIIALERLFDGL